MNVIVFENEYENVRTSFAAANLIYFGKALQIVNYPASQSCPDLSVIDPTACIFVDIDLSAKSVLDGFELLEELLKRGFSRQQIVILTGHLNIGEKAKARGLADVAIITKPIEFRVLHQALAKHQSLFWPSSTH